MADQWDEYLKRAQPKASGGLFASLFGGAGGGTASTSGSGLQPNKQGMYTPSLMTAMPPPGPPTPINYNAIRGLLSSGVLRTGEVAPPAPMPAPAPEPAADTSQASHPLARLFSLFAGLGK
jgi:hypothetical protein